MLSGSLLLMNKSLLLDNFSRDNLNLSKKFMVDHNLEDKWLIFANCVRKQNYQIKVYKDLVKDHDYPLLDSAVSYSAAVGSALSVHKPLYMHRSKSSAANDFEALTEELTKRFEGKE